MIKLLSVVMLGASLFAAPPVIFGIDIDSGPKTGGENGNGAYVRIFGKNFGATRGSSTVTLNGGAVAAYTIWGGTSYGGQEMLCVELGSAVSTGVFVVTVGGVASNNSPTFTVRSGTIYFVATTGNDSNAGTFASPWLTILKPKNTMAAGDIAYIRNGVVQDTDDGDSCFHIADNHGTAGNPKAIVGYPGATATIGKTTSPCDIAIRTFHAGAFESYWTFANIQIRAVADGVAGYAIDHWRFVNVDVQCPNGDGPSGCHGVGGGAPDVSTNVKLLFSNVGPAGISGASSLYHGVYWSLIQGVEIAWNNIHDVHGCRGIQFHSPGAPMGNIAVHDNIIHDTVCDGIIFADGSDPNIGQISGSDVPAGINLYNNVLYNVGQGPNPPDSPSAMYGMNIQDYKSVGQSSGGTVQVYNNTFYAPGKNAANPGGCWAVYGGTGNSTYKAQFRNNVCQFTTGNAAFEYYWQDNGSGGNCNGGTQTNCGRVFGDHNIFFGDGAMWTDANMTSSTVSDPLFVNTGTFDLRLQATSPAKNGGEATLYPVRDFDGLVRPQNTTPSYGAFEIDAGGGGGSSIGLKNLGLFKTFGKVTR